MLAYRMVYSQQRLGRIQSIVDRYQLARVAEAYDDLEHGRLTR